MNLPIRQNFATSACVFIRKTSLSAVHLSYSAPMHILVLLYFAELSCLCNFLVESSMFFFVLDSVFAHVHQTFCFINKRFCTCANAFLNKFTVRSCEYYTYLHWTLYWMQDNQTATYFLRSRLFTYDIMKKFNCN